RKVIAMVERYMGRKAGARRILVGLVRYDRDAFNAFGAHLLGNQRNRDVAVIGLAAGHRYGIVEEDLVGDADARSDRGTDGKQARVIVGPIADVLKDVLAVRE